MDRRVVQVDVAGERRAGERRRGRPPNTAPSERMAFRIPQLLYDAMCREAIRADVPLAQLVRSTLAQQFLSSNKHAALK